MPLIEYCERRAKIDMYNSGMLLSMAEYLRHSMEQLAASSSSLLPVAHSSCSPLIETREPSAPMEFEDDYNDKMARIE